jgi:hypothetical protein
MDSSTVFVDPVLFQRIINDCTKRPEKRKIAPKSVINRYMSLLELPGSRGPHPFSWILQTPQIQIADLRPVHNRYSANTACRDLDPSASFSLPSNLPCLTRADGEYEILRQKTSFSIPNAIVESFVDFWEALISRCSRIHNNCTQIF